MQHIISMYPLFLVFITCFLLLLCLTLRHTCRRGNWITLKMRKLIKPKRERMRSLTLTPSRSESGDGFLSFPLDSQDSSSIGSGSNSLDDTLTQKRSSSECKANTHISMYISSFWQAQFDAFLPRKCNIYFRVL